MTQAFSMETEKNVIRDALHVKLTRCKSLIHTSTRFFPKSGYRRS